MASLKVLKSKFDFRMKSFGAMEVRNVEQHQKKTCGWESDGRSEILLAMSPSVHWYTTHFLR